MELIEKSFQVKLKEEPDDAWIEIRAKSQNEAKTIYLKYNDGNYLNVKVKRNKPDDLVLFEDNKFRRYNVENILEGRKFRKEMQEFAVQHKNKQCYIYSGQ